jgi:hypothetical protein
MATKPRSIARLADKSKNFTVWWARRTGTSPMLVVELAHCEADNEVAMWARIVPRAAMLSVMVLTVSLTGC